MKWRYQLALLTVRAKFKILSAFSKKKAAASAFDLFCTPSSRHNKPLPPVLATADKTGMEWRNFSIHGFHINKGAGRKVLIIHGFRSSSANFADYFTLFRDRGFEVLAFDAPAHGGSSGKRINAAVYRDFIRLVAATHGPFEIIIAHSLGGLALCLALEDWPGQQPAKAILIAPATETTTAVDQYFRMIRIHDKKVHQEFDNLIVELAGHPPAWFSLHRTMQHSSLPFLWVHDEEDEVTPIADAERVWDLQLPNIRVIRTKGLGHRKIYRDEGVMNAVVDFVESGK